jgi:hypothetical protein
MGMNWTRRPLSPVKVRPSGGGGAVRALMISALNPKSEVE